MKRIFGAGFCGLVLAFWLFLPTPKVKTESSSPESSEARVPAALSLPAPRLSPGASAGNFFSVDPLLEVAKLIPTVLPPLSRASRLTEEEADKAYFRELDRYHRSTVDKDPSPLNLSGYALFLFTDKRFGEALDQMARIENPTEKDRHMISEIDRIGRISDPDERDNESFKLTDWFFQSETISPPPDLPLDPAIESALPPTPKPQDFLSKSDVPPSNAPYQPSDAETYRTNIIGYYRHDGDTAAAEAQFNVLVDDYPDSPLIRVESVLTLLSQGQMDQALQSLSTIESDVPGISSDPRWIILRQMLAQKDFESPVDASLRIEGMLQDYKWQNESKN